MGRLPHGLCGGRVPSGTWPGWPAPRRPPCAPWCVASSATSSSMLLATPSAQEACPAAVMGMSPIRKAGEPPRRGRGGEQLEGAPLGHEEVGDVVVVAARPLQPLDVPAVGEDDLVAGDHRHQQRGDPVVADHQLAVHRGHEAGGHVLGMPGAGAELPGPGDPVAAVDRLAQAVREELAAHRHQVVVGGEHLGEPVVGEVGGTGRRRGEVGDADPAERAVLPGQLDPRLDHLGERRLGAAGLGGVEPLQEAGLPQGLDGAGRQRAPSLARRGLLGDELAQRRGRPRVRTR